MSDVDADIIVDERLRAALLWDVPRLQGDDGGLQQWRRALRLDFINLGPLDDEDVVSLAAHAVEAGMTGQTERVDNYALALTRLGPAGSLMRACSASGLSETSMVAPRWSRARWPLSVVSPRPSCAHAS